MRSLGIFGVHIFAMTHQFLKFGLPLLGGGGIFAKVDTICPHKDLLQGKGATLISSNDSAQLLFKSFNDANTKTSFYLDY